MGTWEEDHLDGILRETDFEDNGFAIDPADCGCTDCCVGQAFHPDQTRCLWAVIRQDRPLENRTGHEVILPNGIRLAAGQTWRRDPEPPRSTPPWWWDYPAF